MITAPGNSTNMGRLRLEVPEEEALLGVLESLADPLAKASLYLATFLPDPAGCTPRGLHGW